MLAWHMSGLYLCHCLYIPLQQKDKSINNGYLKLTFRARITYELRKNGVNYVRNTLIAQNYVNLYAKQSFETFKTCNRVQCRSTDERRTKYVNHVRVRICSRTIRNPCVWASVSIGD